MFKSGGPATRPGLRYHRRDFHFHVAGEPPMRLLLNWLLSAVALLIVSFFVPGFKVQGFKEALIAAIVIGLINATLGLLLKLVTLPLTILTLGVFLWVVNAFMLII